jgi:MFS family permease
MSTLRHPLGTTRPDRYKWTALSNTTLGVFMASLDSSIVIISLPAIFRGIQLNPLQPGNIGYLLWMLIGYMLVTAVLVVTFGRIGDMFGRVRMYNAGFAVFTLASLALALTPGIGTVGATELIVMRLVQGIGGALLMANSTAIVTDAFPAEQRGMAMGISNVAWVAGTFVGLIAGGLLAVVHWRLVFLINVPFGLFGTVWAYAKLREVGQRTPARIDWWGNATFAAGLILVLMGITYGIQPAGGHAMGWASPLVIGAIAGGAALLVLFVWIERRVAQPMFDLSLFRVRAFAAGSLATLLSSVGRGGLQFMLIFWLQGIWLPLHGYSYEQAPLWAGIYMLPLTAGFLIAGPLSGWLSDRYGPRPFTVGGMVLAATTFGLLTALPVDFAYPLFATVLLANGIGFGLFTAPNTTSVMNAAPARSRGAASGMRATFQNGGTVLSIGLFFSLLIAGLVTSLPRTMESALVANGVPGPAAARVAHLPPVGTLFAAILGSDPIQTALGPSVVRSLPPDGAAHVTATTFFPRIVSGPFKHGLVIAFAAASLMCLVAAAASWLRGGRYVDTEADRLHLSRPLNDDGWDTRDEPDSPTPTTASEREVDHV